MFKAGSREREAGESVLRKESKRINWVVGGGCLIRGS